MVKTEQITIKPEDSDKGLRIDVFLSKALPDVSRSRIQSLIAQKSIYALECAIGPSNKIKGHETFIIEMPEPKPSHMIAQDIPLDVLYEDDDIIVINKPAGLVVHPGAGNKDNTLTNALLFRFPGFNVGDVERPGLVHRLDKDTSGVMVCARNNEAHLYLTNSFKSRDVKKIYRAFCLGQFKSDKFELKTGHKRHPSNRKKFTTAIRAPLEPNKERIRLAHTQFKVLQTKSGITELEVQLQTGRTHQIRAHLADIGHPLVKDELYGGVNATNNLRDPDIKKAVKQLNRHALHAEFLAFIHPQSKILLEFKAPLPLDLQLLHDAICI